MGLYYGIVLLCWQKITDSNSKSLNSPGCLHFSIRTNFSTRQTLGFSQCSYLNIKQHLTNEWHEQHQDMNTRFWKERSFLLLKVSRFQNEFMKSSFLPNDDFINSFWNLLTFSFLIYRHTLSSTPKLSLFIFFWRFFEGFFLKFFWFFFERAIINSILRKNQKYRKENRNPKFSKTGGWVE